MRIGIKNQYIIEGDTVKILLNSNFGEYWTLVDLSDFEWIKDIDTTWCLRSKEDLYAQRNIYLGKVDGKDKYNTIKLHDIIMDCPKEMFVDHINAKETLDNRRSNLRIASCKDNDRNRKGANKNNKSGVRNVFWNKQDQKYVVQLMVNGKNKRVGSSKDLHKAAEIAAEMRKKYYGDFAGQG